MRPEYRPQVDEWWFELTDELWAPTVRREDGTKFELSVDATDRYVVVDEIVDMRMRLVGAPWPVLDRGRRVRFGKGRRTKQVVLVDRLESAVGAHRDRQRQLHRPIRIGDAFWVRGYSADPSKWETVIDITDAARRAARVAFLSAVAPPTPDKPRLPEEMLRPETLAAPQEPPAPTPGSVANPAV